VSVSRHVIRVLLPAFAPFLLTGCQPLVSQFLLPKEGIREAQYPVHIDRETTLKTADGVALVADIYRPEIEKATPTILVRIPFTKTFKNSLGADAVGRFWASRGYTVVIQGTRGRYKSGGDYYPLLHERDDGIDTLKWLTQQPWFDGRLGMWGGSAFGYTQWVLADQSEPGPAALMIQIASTDFHGMFYPGGAFSLESALFWAARSHGTEDEDPSFAALERGFQGFPLIEADDRAVGDVPFFDDWALHTQADAYWKRIDGEQRARTIRAPVLLMAGWSDPFLPTQLRDFEALREQGDPQIAADSHLVIGPWTHADPIRFPDGSIAGGYRAASLAPSIPWFDHCLLGRPLDNSLAAPVRIYVMGENVWRNENEWPLARTRYMPFYLSGEGHANSRSGDGVLTLVPPAAAEPADSYVYDPRKPVPSRGGAMLGPRAGIALQDDVEARDDVLVHSTEPLEQDLEVTGPVSAVLHVATTAISTDFTVKLVDVHPDGHAYNVSDGILRREYAPLPGPDASAEVTVDLWPTSMLFRRNDRIRVEVSSSNFPRFDRNPNTGRDIPTETSPVSAHQTVFHGVLAPSRIILPVIPR
jgi:putative CocE/NonD family hydrolase